MIKLKNKMIISVSVLSIIYFIVSIFFVGIITSENHDVDFHNHVEYIFINSFINYFNVPNQEVVQVSSVLNAREGDQTKIVVYLQKNIDGEWINVKSWTELSTSTKCRIEETYTVASGWSYRTKSYGFVYMGDNIVESTSYLSNTLDY
jgi:hypothetical protein